LLHTGSSYADELSEDGAIYHFPKTEQPGRDIAEIGATKAASIWQLPVFFVSNARPKAPTRDVRLAWVQAWNDDQKWFYVRFGEYLPSELPPSGNPESTFAVTAPRERISRTSNSLRRSPAFKFAVFDRYQPAECCVCGVRVAGLLDAAHVVGVEHDGTDDPGNGLVFMCDPSSCFRC
jgi:putative restriction endonuclease